MDEPRLCNMLQHDTNEETIRESDVGIAPWSVLVGCFFAIFATFGFMDAIGTIQVYWMENQLAANSSSAISWITGLNLFLFLLAGILIGPWIDHFGPRWILMGGSILYVTSIFILSVCNTYWQFMLVYGLLMGLSSSCIGMVAVSLPAQWFMKKIGLAMGIMSVGSSLGGIVTPLVLHTTFEDLSWARAMHIQGCIAAFALIVANICARERLRNTSPVRIAKLAWFRDPRFVWTTIGIACKYPDHATLAFTLVCCLIQSRILTDGMGVPAANSAKGFEFVLFNSLSLIPVWAVAVGFTAGQASTAVVVLNAYVPGPMIYRGITDW